MVELHPELACSIVNDLPVGIAIIDTDGRGVCGDLVLSESLCAIQGISLGVAPIGQLRWVDVLGQ